MNERQWLILLGLSLGHQVEKLLAQGTPVEELEKALISSTNVPEWLLDDLSAAIDVFLTRPDFRDIDE